MNYIEQINKALKDRKHTYYGTYCDVSVALEKFSTAQLLQYYISICGETGIRSYLEDGIIADEISKERNKNEN